MLLPNSEGLIVRLGEPFVAAGFAAKVRPQERVGVVSLARRHALPCLPHSAIQGQDFKRTIGKWISLSCIKDLLVAVVELAVDQSLLLSRRAGPGANRHA